MGPSSSCIDLALMVLEGDPSSAGADGRVALMGSLNGHPPEPASSSAVCRRPSSCSPSPTSAPSTVDVDLGLSWVTRRTPSRRVVVIRPPTASRLSDAVVIIIIIIDVQRIVFVSLSTFWSRRRASPLFSCSATGLKARSGGRAARAGRSVGACGTGTRPLLWVCVGGEHFNALAVPYSRVTRYTWARVGASMWRRA